MQMSSDTVAFCQGLFHFSTMFRIEQLLHEWLDKWIVLLRICMLCALLNNLPALLQVFTSALEPRNIVALIYIFWWWHDYYNYTIMRCYRNRSEKLLSASAYSNYVKLQCYLKFRSEFRSSTRYRNFSKRDSLF